MDVKQAVQAAKKYVENIYVDEHISNLGLEEVEHDGGDVWNITIGFSRPWNVGPHVLSSMMRNQAPDRSFKVVTIRDSNGEVMGLRNRG